MKSECNICSNSARKIFEAVVLGKYNVNYFQCEHCAFIQTDKPYWLKEAYISAITSIDVGLIYRNLHFSNIVPTILDLFSNEKDAYIDYGGGYGMFVRVMRDKGYDFYLHDIYAENLFARYFELKNYPGKGNFAALTAFEVFEHLENPAEELTAMFDLTDTIIFSTDLQPVQSFTKAADWWYFTPETGQHISFYNTMSLTILSQRFDCKLYSNGHNLHMLTKQNFLKDPFSDTGTPIKSLTKRIINGIAEKLVDNKTQRTSLLQQDFELYRSKLNNEV